MSNSRRIGVRAIIFHNNTLLAVRHRQANGSAAPFYSAPGGGLDPGEPLIEGVRRELFEETGVTASVGRLLFIQQFASTRPDYSEELEFFYLIENPEDFLAIDLSSTSHGDAEITACEFVDPKYVTILPAFLSRIDIANYVATVQPPYHYVEL